MPYFMPCPFCGARTPSERAETGRFDFIATENPDHVCRVECALCGAHGPTFSDKDYPNDFEDLAREAWNTRAGTD